jgi:excinuclease ABC subunit C
MDTEAHIKARLAGLPEKPGVYIMRDARRRVIYVGKANVLRNRVRSYFHQSAGHTGKTERLVADIADLEWIVTESELEALILECELIKRYRPRYNVRFKDDKRYPYIKITMGEDFPRIMMSRNMARDGSRYFGPFTSAQVVYQSLEALRRLFPYRTCNIPIDGKASRPCLYYHIGRCMGPCIGAVTKEEYRAMIDRACLFLEGKQEQVMEQLYQDMAREAEGLHFEKAAKLRDQINAINQIIERQRIVSGHLNDHDFIAMARDDTQACVQVFFVRVGKLIGREYFLLTGTSDETEAQVMSSFITQFYDEAASIPPEILVQHDLDELAVIEEWLRRKRKSKVLIHVPKRGEKRAILDMAIENAVEIQAALNLPEPPSRIECYDISTTQGTAVTGSMVVFAKGVPSKSDYRHFRIKSVEGQDDYASMAEVLRRRFARARQAQEERAVGEKDNRWALMPDLVIIDGGKGQLRAAREAMAEVGAGHLRVVGLAKQEEVLFVPGRPDPIVLPRDSQGLYMLQRIRDEAHRFAITYHRKLRDRQGMRSVLEEIPGIGPQRRRALLERFGSVDGIRQASVEDLIAVPGMNRRAAEQVLENL